MHKSKQKHLYRDELKKLLIMYSVSFIVASIILVFVFIQVYSSRVVRTNNHKANSYAGHEIIAELDAYEQGIIDIESDKIFIDYLKTGKGQSEVYRIMYDFINERQMKSVFYYVNTSGKTILTNNYIESPYNSSDIFISGLFKQLSSRPNEVVFLNNKVQIDLTKRSVYSIGKSIRIDGEIKGYLLFDILESDINKIIYKANAEVLIITDQYNNVITTTNSLVLDDIGKFNLAKNKKDTFVFNNKEYYYTKSQLKYESLYLYTLSELDLVSNIMTTTLMFVVVVFVLITIVAILVAEVASKKKTESIHNLITAINKVQKGDLQAFVPLGRTDEFKLIGEQFNQMLVDVHDLLEKNNELVDRNRLSEIKQLESQFNPHFIFNTLETLKYMVHIDKEKASDIIMNFATILRYSIDYEKKDIPLDQDLDYLNSYLVIQKFRYNKRLTYSFDIQKEAKDCIVPKLIMQPIIENCINHGYNKKESLHIDVKIIVYENSLIATIRDDGDGISEERLYELRRELLNASPEQGHLGLNNVNRRINLLYGDEYGLDIASIKEEGTIVTVKMPVIRW